MPVPAHDAGGLPPVPPVPPPVVPGQPGWSSPAGLPTVLEWSVASANGIAATSDPQATGPIRFGGHVNAFLAWGDSGALAGADTGGVWQLTPGQSSTVAAVPLSDNWDNPDILCLNPGPYGNDHAFAGCRSLTESVPITYASLPVLYEALPGTLGGIWFPIMDSAADGTEYGSVFAIGVAESPGRPYLVAATTTGVWSAAVPPLGEGRQYFWQQATWQGAGATTSPVGCTGLAIALGVPVVSAGSGGSIWLGSFDDSGALTLTQSFAGVANADRSSLAVCASDQSHVWCVIADAGTGGVAAVACSADGGQSWQTILDGYLNDGGFSGPLSVRVGVQGSYNNCIAVSPAHPSTVLIGWQNGVFITVDAGQTYIRWSGDRPNLHRDVHAVYFDPRDASGQTVYVGSDGGVTWTGDFGATLDSSWNTQLANLQLASVPSHNGYGTMTAHPAQPGTVAAGLQDNGVAWCPGPATWREITSGDGAAAIFTTDGRLVAAAQGVSVAIFEAQNGAYQSITTPPYYNPDGTLVTTVVDGQAVSAGLPDPVMEAVIQPGYAGPPVYVVAANGPDPGTVFGLRWTAADASDAAWARLAELPAGDTIWSFAAPTDETIYVGTQPARVYRLDLSESGWSPAELTGLSPTIELQAADVPTITRLVPLADGSLLAVYCTSPYAAGARASEILRYSPADGAWSPITGPGTGLDNEPLFGLDADDQGVLYAATDDRVLVSAGPGKPWQPMSSGLPRRAHLGHLRFVKYPGGGINLFLSTWGRSVWQASWHAVPVPWNPGEAGQPGLAFNQLVGSLVDGPLFQLGPGGLTPVGPIDPEQEQAVLRVVRDAADNAARLTAGLARTATANPSPDVAAALARTVAMNNELQRGVATRVFADLPAQAKSLAAAAALAAAAQAHAQALGDISRAPSTDPDRI